MTFTTPPPLQPSEVIWVSHHILLIFDYICVSVPPSLLSTSPQVHPHKYYMFSLKESVAFRSLLYLLPFRYHLPRAQLHGSSSWTVGTCHLFDFPV